MNCKKVGLILLIVALLLFLRLITAVIINDLHRWLYNLDGFRYKYHTFADMLYSREKGAFLISLIAGLFPASIGSFLHWGINDHWSSSKVYKVQISRLMRAGMFFLYKILTEQAVKCIIKNLIFVTFDAVGNIAVLMESQRFQQC